MSQVLQEFEGRPRRPTGWWLTYLDGQVHAFTEGEDFGPGRVEATRMSALSYVVRRNRDYSPADPMYMKLHTHKKRNEEGLWVLQIAARYPNQVPGS